MSMQQLAAAVGSCPEQLKRLRKLDVQNRKLRASLADKYPPRYKKRPLHDCYFKTPV
jgi:hypothetical protein